MSASPTETSASLGQAVSLSRAPVETAAASYPPDATATALSAGQDGGTRPPHADARTVQRVLAGLRAERRDPGHGGRAAELRGSKNAAHQRAVKAWTGPRPDPALFVAEILPGLRRVALADMAAITGLSEHHCSLIRLGKRPHPRHWEAFRAATQAEVGSASER